MLKLPHVLFLKYTKMHDMIGNSGNLHFSPYARVCNSRSNLTSSNYAESRIYAMKRHSVFENIWHVHKKSMFVRFSVNTTLILVGIMHFYSTHVTYLT